MEDVQGLMDQVKSEITGEKSDEEVFQKLQPLFYGNPEIEGRVAEFLGNLPQEKAVRLLRRMLEVSKEKKARKVIKRSLYRLKSKGVAVEEVPAQRGESILRPLQLEPQEGFASAITPFGERFLLLAIPHPGRGWTVMHGVTNDTEGLVFFSGEEMSRKGFKRFFEEIQEKTAIPLVEAEPSYVGYLFAQAYQLTLEKKKTPPQDYLHLKGEMEKVKKEYERPLVYSHLKGDEISKDHWLLSRGADLLKKDLFSDWRIGEDLIKPYADAIWEAEESKLVLNQAQKEARFQEIYLKALTELFSEERRLLYKRRMEEMAYVLLKLEREEDAKICLSIAIDLEKPIHPIQPNPFLYQLVIRSIFALLAEAYEKKKSEPSFIVKP